LNKGKSGKVLFKCGCSVWIENIKRTHDGHKCLVHKEGIEFVQKPCKYCGIYMQFTSIQQMNRKHYCSNMCAKQYLKKINQDIDDNPIYRDVDCKFYNECLTILSHSNKHDMGCITCVKRRAK